MLAFIMIVVWGSLGLIGGLLLWHTIIDDELLADEEGEHDVPDRGE